LAVVLGLVAAEHLGLGTEAPATGLALAKIRRVLPANLANRVAGVQENLGLTLRRRETTARPATATLLTLGAATRSGRRVTITYRSWRGGVSLRHLDPYGLVFHAGRWYVTGHDHRRSEIRTFRVDRISAVDTGAESFDRPAGFDPVAHVTRSLARVPYTWEVEVLLETDLDQARRRVPATVAEITESADGVLLRTRAQSLDGMACMLAGLGWPFTILRPDELREAVIAHTHRLTTFATRVPDQDDRHPGHGWDRARLDGDG
jgi:predicted DNA-binding transcriptional regulator YafY